GVRGRAGGGVGQARRNRTLGWRPRSLQARQLLAASLGLLAFLAAAGYALDRAFVDVASELQRDRLRSYATSYARDIEFDRAGNLIPPYTPPDARFERPGSGLYAEVVLADGSWASESTRGPQLPEASLYEGGVEKFEGPLPITRADGTYG